MRITKRFWVVPTFALLLVGLGDYRHERSEASEPDNAVPTFEFAPLNNQYVFIAFGSTASAYIQPISQFQFDGSNRFRIFVHDSTVDKSNSRHPKRLWTVGLYDVYPNGDSSGSIAIDRTDDANDAVDIRPITKDASAESALGGIKIYRIDYGITQGQTRFLLIAISDNTAIFPLLFSLPREPIYEHYDWNHWPNDRERRQPGK